mmetsp:Transcript_4316/g.10738  ORF Transcript_4316/g.10738 Transcript_4316/m.10738 type:complete len:207 (-) Transcript_4316:725-1345(-)
MISRRRRSPWAKQNMHKFRWRILLKICFRRRTISTAPGTATCAPPKHSSHRLMSWRPASSSASFRRTWRRKPNMQSGGSWRLPKLRKSDALQPLHGAWKTLRTIRQVTQEALCLRRLMGRLLQAAAQKTPPRLPCQPPITLTTWDYQMREVQRFQGILRTLSWLLPFNMLVLLHHQQRMPSPHSESLRPRVAFHMYPMSWDNHLRK